MYAGTSGKQQGDKNETNPAMNAKEKVTDIEFYPVALYFIVL